MLRRCATVSIGDRGSHGQHAVPLDRTNRLLGAAGEYGDPLVGDPIQCDELLIEHANGTTEIVLYNRAIMLFRSNDEIYKQIHRVCCTIERVTGPAQQDPVL